MFGMGFDRAFRAAVFLFTGDVCPDEDFAAYVEVLEKILMLQDEPGAPPCVGILVIDPGAPVPNARWRAEVAKVASRFKPPTYFALVTESAIVRGVSTAVRWLAKPRYEQSSHATFEQAAACVETKRGAKLPMLAALLDQARARAARGERVPPFPPGPARR